RHFAGGAGANAPRVGPVVSRSSPTTQDFRGHFLPAGLIIHQGSRIPESNPGPAPSRFTGPFRRTGLFQARQPPSLSSGTGRAACSPGTSRSRPLSSRIRRKIPPDGQDQNETLDDVLPKRINIEHAHAIIQADHDQRPDDGAGHAAGSSLEA